METMKVQNVTPNDLPWKINYDAHRCTLCGSCVAACSFRAIESKIERRRLIFSESELPDPKSRFSAVPVIMLTVKSEDTDIAKGLELGADDYVTKPFSHIELLARVQAVMRRGHGAPAPAEEQPYTSGKLHVDFARNEVTVDGKPVKLTSTEYKLLYYLIKNEGRLLSHDNLLTKACGEAYRDARDLLRVHIQHLRQKLGDNVESPGIIVTEHGMGYKFVGPA